MNPDLLSILCCPQTHQALSPADPEQIGRINRLIESNSCKNQAGDVITSILESALIRQDGQMLYPIRNDIPVLLPDEGISCANSG
jgi:uncharacterized protein